MSKPKLVSTNSNSNNSNNSNNSSLYNVRDYRLLHAVGSGTYGTVYKGINIHTNEIVAIKVYPPDDETVGLDRRNMLEASILKTLKNTNCPNIVRLLHEGHNKVSLSSRSNSQETSQSRSHSNNNSNNVDNNTGKSRLVPRYSSFSLNNNNNTNNTNSNNNSNSNDMDLSSDHKQPQSYQQQQPFIDEKHDLLDMSMLQPVPRSMYLILEYLPQNLDEFLYYTPRILHPDHVRLLMQQLINALSVCHKNKFMHRDVKPANLLLSSDASELKLADFGLARSTCTVKSTTKYTPKQVISRWYRAPEVLMGFDDYGIEVDMFSVGLIFAELLLFTCIKTEGTGSQAILQGKTDLGQLYLIFDLRGFPFVQSYPELLKLPMYDYLQSSYGHYNGKPLSSLFPKPVPDHALDLLDCLLQVNPEFRITAENALAHKYFHL